MAESLLELLADGNGSAAEKLRALSREAHATLDAEFLEIRLNGVGESSIGARPAEFERRPIGPVENSVGEILVAPAGKDLTPFIRCAELIHRLQAGYVDGLTGLYNRRRLDLEISTQSVASNALAVVMIDIDHFKKVNDTYGHEAGDAVLKAFSARILEAAGVGTFLARYGGEEFCLLMPESNEEAAYQEADRLRLEGSKEPIVCGSQLIRITSSAGVSAGPASRSAELMKAADEALYQAKEGGRDQVVRSGDVVRRQAARILRRRFRRVLDRPLLDIGGCGQRVSGLDRAEDRVVLIDYFSGVVPVGGKLDGALSFASAGGTTIWVPSEGRGVRAVGRPAGDESNPAGSRGDWPELRRIQYDAHRGRLFLIDRLGEGLYWTDRDLTAPRRVPLPPADRRGLTAVLPIGRSVLVLDALGRRIWVLDRVGLQVRRFWMLPGDQYELCLCYIPDGKLLLVGGGDGILFLAPDGTVRERSDQPVISAFAHPLVGLTLSTPEETFVIR